VTARSLVLAAALYLVRMFAITAGYHRLFSHRSYRTSRVFQFLLGCAAQSSAQSGVLWWAARHREHHRHSDTELDPHSPAVHGFFVSHVGWVFHRRAERIDRSLIPDLTRCRELVWLDRHQFLPAVLLAGLCLLIGGGPGLVVGFGWSTVATWHATFAINSLAHVHGTQRYVTGDDSRNNLFLALLTLGEGWHNNHHWYQASTRQGFRWWEVDVTYYVLRALSWCGIVWDLKLPPAEVVRGDRPLPRALIERAAWRLAAAVHARWKHSHPPDLGELRTFAEAMFARTPSLDEILVRARGLLAERRLAGSPTGA
jgi:stearoyl-CoA desaturase (delta-9 desaturase)